MGLCMEGALKFTYPSSLGRGIGQANLDGFLGGMLIEICLPQCRLYSARGRLILMGFKMEDLWKFAHRSPAWTCHLGN